VFPIFSAASAIATQVPQNTPQRDAAYTQLRAAKLSGEAVSVKDLTIHRDAATFVFNKGDFYFLEAVAGKVPGAVFMGDGEFQIVPPIAIEKRNLMIFTGEPAHREPFSELVLHFTDGSYAEIVAQNTVRKEMPNSRASSALENRLQLLRKGRTFSSPNVAAGLLNTNLASRLLTDLYDPAHAGFFNAFIKGKKFGDLMFRIDPQGVPDFEPEEVILASLNDSDLGVWNAFHLKDHYSQGPAADEDHRLMDLEQHQIDATIKGAELSAKVRTTFRVTEDGPRVLRFDLFPTLRVSRVVDEEGQPLTFIQEGKDDDPDLAVIFPQPLKKGPHKLDFEYSGKDALHNDGSGNYTLVARDNWYPNSYFGDRATYDMTFRFSKDLILVASGQPKETRQEGNLTVARWMAEVPVAVAGFNYGRFKRSETRTKEHGYLIESYANREIPDDLKAIQEFLVGVLNTTSLMDKARSEAEISLRIYSNYFGALPYGRLAMTQQSAPNFGQAWPMLVYMPITSYLDSTMRHQLGLTSAADFFKIVGPHEVAHQWWGHVIGWKSYRDQWMSEGFAEFSASLFSHLVYKDEEFKKFWKEERELILEKTKSGATPADVGSVTLGYRIDSGKTPGIARRMIYPKGGFILHMLRMMMYDHRGGGDARFIKMMRDFVQAHLNQNVSTEDFKQAIEKHMTQDMDLDNNQKMDWFFNEFVYGTEIPRYKVDYQLEASGEQTVLKLRVTQSEVPDAFKMPVPIYMEMDNKKIARLGVLRITGNSHEDITVPLPFRPRSVFLCAYEDILADIDGR